MANAATSLMGWLVTDMFQSASLKISPGIFSDPTTTRMSPMASWTSGSVFGRGSPYAVKWTIRPPAALQSLIACFHGFPLWISKGPPNLSVTSRIVDSTTLSSWSAIMTPSAPRARAVRQTWVVTLESLKTRWPIRRMTILANAAGLVC